MGCTSSNSAVPNASVPKLSEHPTAKSSSKSSGSPGNDEKIIDHPKSEPGIAQETKDRMHSTLHSTAQNSNTSENDKSSEFSSVSKDSNEKEFVALHRISSFSKDEPEVEFLLKPGSAEKKVPENTGASVLHHSVSQEPSAPQSENNGTHGSSHHENQDLSVKNALPSVSSKSERSFPSVRQTSQDEEEPQQGIARTHSVVSLSAEPQQPAKTPSPTPVRVEAPPIKKGMLVKQGHLVKNMKNRFFVLEEGVLCYYENQSVNPPYGVNKKGELSLLGTRLDVNKNYLSIICIDPTSGKETLGLLLDVKYPNERSEWVDAIKQHQLYLSLKNNT
jgi:hypothetical protein